MLCEQNINMAAIRENTLPLDKNSLDTAVSARTSTAALNLAFKGIFLGSIQVKLNILSLMLNINNNKKSTSISFKKQKYSLQWCTYKKEMKICNNLKG